MLSKLFWQGTKLFSFFVLVAVSLAYVIVPCPRGHGRANCRACFANQKTIAGAIEMYQLDYNVVIDHIDRETLATLRDHGYLQSIPQDPGGWQEHDGRTNYRLCEHGVYCLRHGFIQSGLYGASCRRQLRHLGISDGKRLAEASTLSPNRHREALQDLGNRGATWLFCLVVFLRFLLSFSGLRPFLSDHASWLVLEVLAMALLGPIRVLALAIFLVHLPLEIVYALTWKYPRLPVVTPLERSSTAFALAEDGRALLGKAGAKLLVAMLVSLFAGSHLLFSSGRTIRPVDLPPLVSLATFILAIEIAWGFALALQRMASIRSKDMPDDGLRGISLGSLVTHCAVLLCGGSIASPPLATEDLLLCSLVLGAFYLGQALGQGLAAGLLLHFRRRLLDPCADGADRQRKPADRPVPTLLLPPMRLRLEDGHCPICGEDFRREAAVLCAGCGTPHHRACLDWNGHCATYGCGALPSPRQPSVSLPRASSPYRTQVISVKSVRAFAARASS